MYKNIMKSLSNAAAACLYGFLKFMAIHLCFGRYINCVVNNKVKKNEVTKNKLY